MFAALWVVLGCFGVWDFGLLWGFVGFLGFNWGFMLWYWGVWVLLCEFGVLRVLLAFKFCYWGFMWVFWYFGVSMFGDFGYFGFWGFGVGCWSGLVSVWGSSVLCALEDWSLCDWLIYFAGVACAVVCGGRWFSCGLIDIELVV